MLRSLSGSSPPRAARGASPCSRRTSRAHAESASLGEYLDRDVFATASLSVADPDPADVAGFAAYLDRYRAGLAIEAAATTALRPGR